MNTTARAAVLKVLDAFENRIRNNTEAGNFTDLTEISSRIPEKDKSLFTMLVKGIFRRKRKLDSVIQEFSKRSIEELDPAVLNSLRIGLFEIIYLTRIPEYASLNEAVELVSKTNKKSKPFINAILREILRKRGKIPLIPAVKSTADCLKYSLSYPDWLALYFLEHFGKENAIQYAESLNEEEPLTIRVNALKTNPEKLKKCLARHTQSIRKSEFCKDCLVIESKINIEQLDEYKSGLFYVQNASSQIVAEILHPQKGESILDACAGPGGKATHIQELTGNLSSLYAMDITKKKLDLISQNVKRLGIENVNLIQGDAAKPLGQNCLRKVNGFDKILVDAPCSALGTIRKNPELKWMKNKNDPQRLAKLQLSILKNMAKYLKGGGSLVYSVCTFTKEETFDVANRLLEATKDLIVDPIKSEELPALKQFIVKEDFFFIPPVNLELEPFFIGRFRKT